MALATSSEAALLPIPAFAGSLASMFDEQHFSDISIKLADGTSVYAHRVVLAAASRVLQAKFTSAFKDSLEQTWSPDVGSAVSWRWLIGWMYGRAGPLPLALLVEVLVIADRFEIGALCEIITSLSVDGFEEQLIGQLLHIWATPDILRNIAVKCVPAVALDREFISHLQAAKFENALAILTFAPVWSETERLRLIGLCLQGPRENSATFSGPCFDAVRWEAFPSPALQAACCGNFAYFEKILGHAIPPVSDCTKQQFCKALGQRCLELERHVMSNCAPLESLQLAELGSERPVPSAPCPGLFAKLQNLGVEASLSSVHKGNGFIAPAAVLLTTSRDSFGTNDQRNSDEPWISLKAPSGLCVRPQAIGLMHGWSESDFCKHFVVEASLNDGEWVPLLTCSETPLSEHGEWLEIPEEDSHAGKYFDRFRIVMKGPNSSGRWYLMVGWFDVVGTVASKLFSELTADRSEV